MKMIVKHILGNVLFTATTVGAVCGAVSIANNHQDSLGILQSAPVATKTYSTPRTSSRYSSSASTYDNAMTVATPTDVLGSSTGQLSVAPSKGRVSATTSTSNYSGSLNGNKGSFGRTTLSFGAGVGSGSSTGLVAVALTRPFSNGSSVGTATIGEFSTDERPNVDIGQRVDIGGGGKDEPFYEPLDSEVWCLAICSVLFAIAVFLKSKFIKQNSETK